MSKQAEAIKTLEAYKLQCSGNDAMLMLIGELLPKLRRGEITEDMLMPLDMTPTQVLLGGLKGLIMPAAPPTLEPHLDRFVRLLRNGPGRISKPKTKILNKVQEKGFAAALQVCATPAAALTLYQQAKHVLSTSACVKVAHKYKINVDQMMDVSSSTVFMSGFKNGVGPIVLKTFRSEQAARQEFSVWEALGPKAINHHLVGPVELVQHSEDGFAICMPKYTSTLEQVSLFPDDVLKAGSAIKSALDFMHMRGYGHNDVKPSNVFVDWGTNTRYTLGDLGSAARLDEAVVSTTELFVPSDWGDMTTSRELDYCMLALTLLRKLKLFDATHQVNRGQVQEMATLISDKTLREFVHDLLI
mmetsp:Transcript_23702/g.52016  ORF Transcript_23702/g.52016 Transcript_23702/m.52016 type:complete len:358 (+) Transcript_23702:70-1143(+)